MAPGRRRGVCRGVRGHRRLWRGGDHTGHAIHGHHRLCRHISPVRAVPPARWPRTRPPRATPPRLRPSPPGRAPWPPTRSSPNRPREPATTATRESTPCPTRRAPRARSTRRSPKGTSAPPSAGPVGPPPSDLRSASPGPRRWAPPWPTATPGRSPPAEYDHLIPLELGGDPNDPANLWLEPNDDPGATSTHNGKDDLEDTLRGLVCSGSLSLSDARQAIATDWVAAARRYDG